MTARVATSGAGRAQAPSRATASVAAFSAVMVVLAVAGLVGFGSGWEALAPNRWAPWWVIAALTAAGELMAVHLENRRSAHTVTVKELPMVVGLAVLSPIAFVTSQVVGSGVALILDRRQSPIKLSFNLARVVLESVVAVLVYRAVVDGSSVTSWRGVLAALVVVLVVDVVAALAVTTVIYLHDGELVASVLGDALGHGLLTTLSNAAIAVVALVLLDTRPGLVPLLLVFFAVLFLASRSLARLATAHQQVETLYEFTRTAAQPTGTEPLTASLLAELRIALQAGSAGLLQLERGPEPAAWTVLADGDTMLGSDDGPRGTWWTPALEGQPVLRVGAESGSRGPGGDDGSEAMAVPVRRGGRVVAVLLVAERESAVSRFTQADLDLFAALAGHAGVALENTRLVERLRAEVSEKEYLGGHDALTGLPNRGLFNTMLDDLLRASPHKGVAVVVVDLDRFQEINDAVGHGVGDAVLVAVARRLTAVVADPQRVARLGSDEFAFLAGAGDPGRVDSWATLAASVRTALREPVVVGEVSLEITASLGVAVSPEHGTTARTLLQHADIAMHRAKARRGHLDVYSLADGELSRRRLVLAAHLREAIASGAVEVWFQPQARSADRHVTGVEALIRWRHPELGRIAPEEIIATAERTGMLADVTGMVIDRSLTAISQWRSQGMPLDVAVNLSVRDLLDERLPRKVAAALARHDVPSSSLTLEITESSIMVDLERSLRVLDALAAMGVRLSVDDFGTGQSSLTYLTRLPVHELKIDKSFVIGVHGKRDDLVVRSAVDLAHALGLRVVAEGVEDDTSWDRVQGLGCEVIQGYVLARPATQPDVTVWLSGQTVARPPLQGPSSPG